MEGKSEKFGERPNDIRILKDRFEQILEHLEMVRDVGIPGVDEAYIADKRRMINDAIYDIETGNLKSYKAKGVFFMALSLEKKLIENLKTRLGSAEYYKKTWEEILQQLSK